MNIKGQSFLKLLDFTPKQIGEFIDLAAQLKAKKKTVKDVAEAVGINEATLYRKINGTSDFTRNKIQLIRQYLNLCAEEVDEIFFAD